MNYAEKKLNKYFKNNPELAKQHIRDFYDKLFPSQEDYIRFLRTMYEARLSVMNIGMILEEQQNEEDVAYLKEREIQKFKGNEINDNQLAQINHWEDITTEQINLYKKVLKKLLETKLPQHQQIWNYYILGVPKKRIKTLLKKDLKYIRVVIDNVQNYILENIPPPIKK